jgi:hypothetical protein
MFLKRPTGSDEDESISFVEVFSREMHIIEEARTKRQVPQRPRPLEQDLVGLAFSGGGIRSATFNLGVIQALARNNLLNLVDYLSTVSGGGYIGSWLSSWAYYISKKDKTKENHVSQIEAALNHPAQHLGDAAEPRQVSFLRKYSNYLTPRLGILSGDTLAFVAIYLRNLLLNQVILIGALLSLLLVPRSFGLIFAQFNDPKSILVSGALCVLLLAFVIWQVALNTDPEKFGRKETETSRGVVLGVAVPLFVFCLLLAYLLWQLIYVGYLYSPLQRADQVILVAVASVTYTALWLFATAAGPTGNIAHRAEATDGHKDSSYFRWSPVLWAAPAGFVGGLFILMSISTLQHWVYLSAIDGNWIYLVAFGVPLAAVIVLLVGVVHLGLIGRGYEDGLREWWARLGGIVLAIAACWFLLSLSTLLIPRWLHAFLAILWKLDNSGLSRIWKTLSALGFTGLISGWITAIFKGIFAAKSSETGPRPETGEGAGNGSTSAKSLDLMARLAPLVFVTGLVILLSVVLWECVSIETAWYKVIGLFLCLYVVSRFFGSRVDVNEFSLHNAYRNRIVRCYLGATHENRRPQSFTGFDETDNIYLSSLLELGAPFHILNATLNVVKGKELALQARKARSFVFTPLYSGFDYTGDTETNVGGSYRLTGHSAWNSRYPGARLGTAMAISGAAASPSMGHYTTGAVSFLLTVFSVRLGWWMGNPRIKIAWESGYPRSSWRAIMNELTGNTTDDQNEVYLSDGGHFENLGIYELARRRCRVIIAIDAGADPHCSCIDLASAIEKCRVDFGIQIQISLTDICTSAKVLPSGQTLRVCELPFAKGEIQYPDGSKGTLIYIKPSLDAGLPQDVLAYARSAPTFPHQSTIDQFFDETQFESYRALGLSCATAAVAEITKAMKA